MLQFVRFSMKNVAVIFIVMIMLVVGGSYSASTSKVESMPDIDGGLDVGAIKLKTANGAVVQLDKIAKIRQIEAPAAIRREMHQVMFLLADRVQQLVEVGRSVRESIIEAGLTRIRPIIMTAGATITAMMPLAFGLSPGTIISKGLAAVVIGGLTTSTLLTLVVAPVVYELIYAAKVRVLAKVSHSVRARADT